MAPPPAGRTDGSNGRLRRGHGPAAAGADHGAGAVTADMTSTAGHGSHGLPRPNVPVLGHDPDVTVVTTRKRHRGHGPLWRCRCRSRRVTARTARHGGSRGFCRRRVRGDELTYQGTGLRPAGEAPPYRRAGWRAKKIASTALPAVPNRTNNAPVPLKSRNGYALHPSRPPTARTDEDWSFSGPGPLSPTCPGRPNLNLSD